MVDAAPVIEYPDGSCGRKSRSTCLVLSVVLLSIVCLVLCVVGSGALYLLTAVTEEVTPADRRLVVTIHDLAEYVEDYVPDPEHETITKQRNLDRSFEIEYEYDAPDDEDVPYLMCSLSVEPTLQDARASYLAMWGGVKLGIHFGADEVEIVERNNVFQWGDHSHFGTLEIENVPYGNVFVARKGKLIFVLLISGVYFEDRDTFSDFLAPVLSELDRYRPAKGQKSN